jgi:carbonic anhydrase
MRPTITPAEQARQRLLAGNQRYCRDRSTLPGSLRERRRELRGGQDPFATILTCADSRVIPELIFDQSIGDLFTIRVAGNTLDDSVLASIEYSVSVLRIRLIVVMGHERCGAVKVAIDHLAAATPPPLSPHLGRLVESIAPAVASARSGAEVEDDLIWERVSQIHSLGVARQLARLLAVDAVAPREHPLRLLPAHYHFSSGEVELLAG